MSGHDRYAFSACCSDFLECVNHKIFDSGLDRTEIALKPCWICTFQEEQYVFGTTDFEHIPARAAIFKDFMKSCFVDSRIEDNCTDTEISAVCDDLDCDISRGEQGMHKIISKRFKIVSDGFGQ